MPWLRWHSQPHCLLASRGSIWALFRQARSQLELVRTVPSFNTSCRELLICLEPLKLSVIAAKESPQTVSSFCRLPGRGGSGGRPWRKHRWRRARRCSPGTLEVLAVGGASDKAGTSQGSCFEFSGLPCTAASLQAFTLLASQVHPTLPKRKNLGSSSLDQKNQKKHFPLGERESKVQPAGSRASPRYLVPDCSRRGPVQRNLSVLFCHIEMFSSDHSCH